MREFKFISIAAALLCLFATTSPLWLADFKSVRNDVFFQRQLADLKKIKTKNSLLLYGSSGLLVGLSAESLRLLTGHESRNLSTSGLGGKFELAISLINNYAGPWDTILIGDRDYRSNTLTSNTWSDYFGNISTWFSLTPQLAQYFYSSPFTRTNVGDLASFPRSNFALQKYDPNPMYTASNIDVMRKHVNLIKQAGHCPILVLVPILVKENERVAFEKATSQLFSLVNSTEISDNLVRVPAIETDQSLFLDQFHMSASGRGKWTAAIAHEIMERNICNLASTHQSNDNFIP